jgi:hypothetical protein
MKRPRKRSSRARQAPFLNLKQSVPLEKLFKTPEKLKSVNALSACQCEAVAKELADLVGAMLVVAAVKRAHKRNRDYFLQAAPN